jgi:hypothetical protein
MSKSTENNNPILHSIDGLTPENRVKKIIEHPDPEQLDPAMFCVDQSEMDQPVVKAVQTNYSIRKPEKLEFVRVHDGEDYRATNVPFISLKQSKEFYIVDPALRKDLRPREYWFGTVFLVTNRLEKPFLWIVTTQSPTGRVSDWYTSGLECADILTREWGQLVADQDAGVYQVSFAEERLEEPKWPEQSFKEIFHLGFKRRWISDLNHPVFKQLRGRA